MSDAAQPTPGPWKFAGFSKQSNFADHVAIVQGDGCNLVRVRGGVKDERAVAEANARLIAAAPDLLEALKEITKFFELSDGDGWTCPVWVETKMRAAIAKATP